MRDGIYLFYQNWYQGIRTAFIKWDLNKMYTEKDFLYLMGIGDAFGMKYEFYDHEIPIAPDDLYYGNHPRFLEYQRAHYTDDTQKSLANAELILENDAADLTKEAFVQAWLEVFKRDDPRRGYSTHMFRVMCESTTVADFCSSLDPTTGVTSGAAMGATPFGLLPDVDTVIRLTTLQANITHNTEAGRNAALGVSLSTHFLHHGGKLEFLNSFLDQQLGSDWSSSKSGLTDHPGNGLKIVRHALNALRGAETFSRLLVNGASQARVADTDTICAMAMAIASRQTAMIDDLPECLHTDLENGPYGAGYLKEIDSRLSAQFPRSEKYAAYVP